MTDEFCLKMPDFHVTFRGLLHAVNLRHGTDGFTSLPKEGVLRIFFVLKNPTASAGFEPANVGTKGQYATSRPAKPFFFSLLLLLSIHFVIPFLNLSHVKCADPCLEITDRDFCRAVSVFHPCSYNPPFLFPTIIPPLRCTRCVRKVTRLIRKNSFNWRYVYTHLLFFKITPLSISTLFPAVLPRVVARLQVLNWDLLQNIRHGSLQQDFNIPKMVSFQDGFEPGKQKEIGRGQRCPNLPAAQIYSSVKWSFPGQTVKSCGGPCDSSGHSWPWHYLEIGCQLRALAIVQPMK